jgi:thiol-disulfide isomerase/thioredoxin
MTSRRAVFALFALLAVAAVASASLAGRGSLSNAARFDGEPALIAATFSSAWCAACKILEPRLARVIPQFEGAAVKFVEYDFTFGEEERNRAAALADGVSPDVYDRFAGATGFTLLIDARSGDLIDMLTASHSPKAMRAAIAQALARAGRASVASQ